MFIYLSESGSHAFFFFGFLGLVGFLFVDFFFTDFDVVDFFAVFFLIAGFSVAFFVSAFGVGIVALTSGFVSVGAVVFFLVPALSSAF